MKCNKCGSEIHKLNHYFVPSKDSKNGKRFCFKCAKEEKIITLV
ncbi:MAG: hypothetical protein V1874_16475 [Spirochaetota bacterium]